MWTYYDDDKEKATSTERAATMAPRIAVTPKALREMAAGVGSKFGKVINTCFCDLTKGVEEADEI